MRLTTITLENFKGFSGTYNLAPIALFVGPNFAGKSTVIDAVRLLVLGYLPELGKTNAATFALASGRELSVIGTFDNGATVARRWFVKNDTIKSAFVLPPFMEEQGSANAFAVMMDPQTYFGLSENERVSYIFTMIPGMAEAVTVDALTTQLQEMLATKGDELAADAIANFMAEVRVHLERLARGGVTTNALVEALLEFVKQATSNAKAKAGVMEKTAQGLAFLRTQDGDPNELPAVEKELAEVMALVERLRDEKAKRAADLEAARKWAERRTALQTALYGSHERATVIEAHRARVAELEGKIRDLADDAKPAGWDDMLTEERDQTASLREAMAELDRNNQRLAELQEEKASLQRHVFCPYCGAAGSKEADWRATKNTALENAIAGLGSKQDTLRTHAAALRESLQNLRALIDKTRKAQIVVERLNADLHTARRDLSAAELNAGADEERRKQLAAIPETTVDAASVNALTEKLTAAQTKATDLTRRKQLLVGRSNDLIRLAQAEKQRDESKMAEAVAKTAVEATRALKSKIVAASFHDLLMTANAFFGTVLRTPLEYHDGEIGTWRDGLWVSHRTFSGTERALTYAAIQAALTTHATFRLMLVDELGRLDDKSAHGLMAGVDNGITNGVIDQFIGVDTGRLRFYQTIGEARRQELTVTEIAANPV